jgi:hypothetical protein
MYSQRYCGYVREHKMNKWKLQPGRIYITADNQFMVKNVGYKCWGLYINDGSNDWDLNWVGSTYPSAKSAMLSVEQVSA